MSGGYPHPPIVEAIIEVQFEAPLFPAQIQTAAKLSKYDRTTELKQFNFNFDVDKGDVTAKTEKKGYRLSDKDDREVLIFTANSLVSSNVGAYKGWNNLTDRLRFGLKSIDGNTGFRRLKRLGVRTINRIDIPKVNEEPTDIHLYFAGGVSIPTELTEQFNNFNFRVECNSSRAPFIVILNCSIGPSPLIERVALNIDVDFVHNGRIDSVDELDKLLESMRLEKDFWFEKLITDKTKELFN